MLTVGRLASLPCICIPSTPPPIPQPIPSPPIYVRTRTPDRPPVPSQVPPAHARLGGYPDAHRCRPPPGARVLAARRLVQAVRAQRPRLGRRVQPPPERESIRACMCVCVCVCVCVFSIKQHMGKGSIHARVCPGVRWMLLVRVRVTVWTGAGRGWAAPRGRLAGILFLRARTTFHCTTTTPSPSCQRKRLIRRPPRRPAPPHRTAPPPRTGSVLAAAGDQHHPADQRAVVPQARGRQL